MHYKAIIFDFFGVINTDTGTVWVKKNISDEETRARLKGMFPKVDIGDLAESEFFTTASKIVNRSPEEVRNEWFELSSLDPDVLALIVRLKKDFKVAVCTNAPSALVRDIFKMMGIETLFDEVFISSELKLTKPSPEIFNYVTKSLGIEPHEAIFIDDSIGNVDGAEQAGLSGIHFNNAQELERKLTILTGK